MLTNNTVVDCACVIHGQAYDWIYVDKLYSMLTRNFTFPVRLHVFTEQTRAVPEPYIKHELINWPSIHGPRRAWWYKVQLFNSNYFQGRLLYFDLDVVITGNLDWILQSSPHYFWAIKDFTHMWRPKWEGINSSIMYWDTTKFNRVWENFESQPLDTVTRSHKGDQDYISASIPLSERRFFDDSLIKSWRWNVKDGGLNHSTKIYNRPSAGSILPPNTKIVVFHGTPKPHEVDDSLTNTYWK